MKDPLIWTLPLLVRTIIGKCGNVTAAANSITAANLKIGSNDKVARSTLKQIAEGSEKVSLTQSNLRAIHNYLVQDGEGLDTYTYFQKQGVLDCLASNGKVLFFLATKPSQDNGLCNISTWDFSSVMEIQRAIYTHKHNCRHDTRSVLLNSKIKLNQLETEEWFRLLQDDSHSIISVGSPRACLASEVMLARMFDVPPFTRPSLGRQTSKPLPFHFIWRPKNCPHHPSSFSLGADDIQASHPELAKSVRDNLACAFQTGPKIYPVPCGKKEWSSYGAIVAQRRETGQVWMVIAGLSGPATYAGSTLVDKIKNSLPSLPGERSQVLWMPFVARIHLDPSKKTDGDMREMAECSPLHEPSFWPPPENKQGADPQPLH